MEFLIKIPDHPPLGKAKGIGFKVWLQYQANRLFVGELRYGSGSHRQQYMTRMEKELNKYKQTGNFEQLLNIANYAFLESEFPENKKFHFDPNAASATRAAMGGNIA